MLQLLLYKVRKLTVRFLQLKTRFCHYLGKNPLGQRLYFVTTLWNKWLGSTTWAVIFHAAWTGGLTTKGHHFQCMCGTTIRRLKNRTQIETILKLYKTVALPTLLYGSEGQTMTCYHKSSSGSWNEISTKSKRSEQFGETVEQGRQEWIKCGSTEYTNKQVQEQLGRLYWKDGLYMVPKQIMMYTAVGRPWKRWNRSADLILRKNKKILWGGTSCL